MLAPKEIPLSSWSTGRGKGRRSWNARVRRGHVDGTRPISSSLSFCRKKFILKSSVYGRLEIKTVEDGCKWARWAWWACPMGYTSKYARKSTRL